MPDALPPSALPPPALTLRGVDAYLWRQSRAPRRRLHASSEGTPAGALLGRNGAGKTTSLAAAMGFIRNPVRGRVTLVRRAHRTRSRPRPSPSRGLGLVPQGRRDVRLPHRAREPARRRPAGPSGGDHRPLDARPRVRDVSRLRRATQQTACRVAVGRRAADDGRSGARSWATPPCCCWTSRPRGLRRRWSPRSAASWPG